MNFIKIYFFVIIYYIFFVDLLKLFIFVFYLVSLDPLRNEALGLLKTLPIISCKKITMAAATTTATSSDRT